MDNGNRPSWPDGEGAVFVGTNHNNTSDATQPANQVAMYRRAADGRLTLIGYFDTGGQGSGPGQEFAGDGLGSSNSVQLSMDGRWLFVVNAGSDTLSVFEVSPEGLELTCAVTTGDGSQGHRFPNSVAQHGALVYAMNAADEGSITGLRLSERGMLVPIAGSTRTLDANQERYAPAALSEPAQIAFTPDGSKLLVTIKDGPAAGLIPEFTPTGPGRLLVWDMLQDGRPSATYARTDFDHRGPFGFCYDRHGNLLVAEFVGGGMEVTGEEKALTGAVGSYRINADGTLTPITVAERSHQRGTCWLVNNGRYAFGSNFGSGTISAFGISGDGGLRLLDPAAGLTDHPGNQQGSTPIDLGISPDGRWLYLVEPGAGKVGAWRIDEDGSLAKLGEFPGLPQTLDGDRAPFDFSALGSPAGIAVC